MEGHGAAWRLGAGVPSRGRRRLGVAVQRDHAFSSGGGDRLGDSRAGRWLLGWDVGKLFPLLAGSRGVPTAAVGGVRTPCAPGGAGMGACPKHRAGIPGWPQAPGEGTSPP